MADSRKKVEGAVAVLVGMGGMALARQIYTLPADFFGRVRDCLLFFVLMESLLLIFLGACLYTCGVGGNERCERNCFALYFWLQIAAVVMFIACMALNAGVF